jgi:hypothetical protein
MLACADKNSERGLRIRGDRTLINGKRIAVVMPVYNAEKPLEQTVRELSDVVFGSLYVTTNGILASATPLYSHGRLLSRC